MSRVRVLIVDDSALVRELLSRGLGMDPGIEVIGTAVDPYDARDKIVKLKPDVLTLDVEMPRMTGVEFLKKLMPQYPLPVVMVSSLTARGQAVTLDALAAGAVDFVAKPQGNLASGLESLMVELRAKVKAAATAKLPFARRVLPTAPPGRLVAPPTSSFSLIAIGASTGGTEALASILGALPAGLPPIVIVQHMPPGFTKLFAERLNGLSACEVREGGDGEVLKRGHAIIAPGGFQLRVRSVGGELRLQITKEELHSGHCPSVDVLFESVQTLGGRALGVILTGMGADGAQGLLAMRKAGARTLGQDEASSVVFGMPRVAGEVGAVERVISLSHMAQEIVSTVKAGGS